MENFDKLLESLKEKLQKDNEMKEPYVKALIERLNISKDKASSLVPNVELIRYDPEDFVAVVKYYCDVFNGIDNLEAFLVAQAKIATGVNDAERKNTIFTMKPYTMFGDRMAFLQWFFEVDRNKCVSLVISNPDWLYHKEQYFFDKTKAFIEMFGISRMEIITLYIKYPFILGKRLNGLSKAIEKIAKHFGVEESEVKSLMVEYPLLMNMGMSFYLYNKLGKEIFDKHWLIECLTGYRDCNFGGYRTFASLVTVTDKIEADIGKFVKVYKKVYNDGYFMAILVEKESRKYLVSLGADTVTKVQREKLTESSPEQRILEEILGKAIQITENQEYIYHREYVCQLNTEKEETINDILQMMTYIAAYGVCREVELKDGNNLFYLSDSNYISQCSIETILPLSNEDNYLNLEFYKIEPMGNGKIEVKSFSPPIEDDEFDDFF